MDKMQIVEDLDWSDSSTEAEASPAIPVHARAYQIEMFEQSMQQNIIVTVSGLGKSVYERADFFLCRWIQVLGRLKCEHNFVSIRIQSTQPFLQSRQLTTLFQCQIAYRSRVAKITFKGSNSTHHQHVIRVLTREKRVWFLCPSVVLAHQQHLYLSSQLPAYNFRVITGLDNAEFWRTQKVWDSVLHNRHVVVSTTQILLDALTHGFVSLRDLSLLVFDEAHHCVGNAPMANIMKLFYHPTKLEAGSHNVPFILGLTASPVSSASALLELETNLDAICKSPNRQIQEYKHYVHVPILDRIVYSQNSKQSSRIVSHLGEIVSQLQLCEDPVVKRYIQQDNSFATEKLNKIIRQGYTATIKQMKSFYGNAVVIEEQLGTWAATVYITACIVRLDTAVRVHETVLGSIRQEELQYINEKLQPIRSMITDHDMGAEQHQIDIAPKAQALISYLIGHYHQGVSSIVFVNRRSIAFALTRLLQCCQSMNMYHVFSFVGNTHPSSRNLADLASMTIQDEAFSDFRAGRKNLCIATSVMEEGVDVQAVNLVIRFDLPPTLRAFVQSRGRARRPDSRLVLVCADIDPLTQVAKWGALERELKARYTDVERTLSFNELMELEDGKISLGEIYKVSSTGAVLTYDNARQHLEHFISTVTDKLTSPNPEAIIVISGVVGKSISAQIRLPANITPTLQITNSLRTWRSEKAAVKDAAFQCYRKLHLAGIISDNLLPFRLPDDDKPQPQTRESTYEINEAINPWSHRLPASLPSLQAKPHLLTIRNNLYAFPDLLILMPMHLDHKLSFWLRSTPFGDLNVSITSQQESPTFPISLAYNITTHLFSLILGRRLKSVDLSTGLPYLLVPDKSPEELSIWFDKILTPPTPLTAMTFNQSLEAQRLLVRCLKEEVLYLWSPEFGYEDVKQYKPEDLVLAKRLTKQLNFLNANAELRREDQRELIAENCFIDHLPASYGEVMLLMPSIQHVLGNVLRGQIAIQSGPIKPIEYTDSSLVRLALTASVASADANYESLEFLGDSLLKHYATLHVFCQYPLLPESALSVKRQHLVSNARLQKSTRQLKLDQYITTERLASQSWTLGAHTSGQTRRNISSKTLADVIEALLGAAYLDPANIHSHQDLVIQALQVLLPEAKWQTPKIYISAAQKTIVRRPLNMVKLAEVENMFNYNFKHKELLAEALTKSSLRTGIPSYERLEFLGDSVLDHIVGITLYNSRAGNAERMTLIHHALVNHYILAFLGLRLSRQLSVKNVTTLPTGHTSIADSIRTIRLIDYVTSLPDLAQIEQREKAETTYTTYHDQIATQLQNGKTFPWKSLQSINTSKTYSDIVESIIAATFIDSSGDIEACTAILEQIGLMPILRRLANNPDIEVRTPLALLRLHHPSVGVQSESRGQISKGSKRWRCTLTLDDVQLSQAMSRVSQSHAESLAAEIAFQTKSSNESPIDET